MVSNVCVRCNWETDTILHQLWEFEKVVLLIQSILAEAQTWENWHEQIKVEDYLFGIEEVGCEGLNHFLLELKIFIFYDFVENEGLQLTIDRFYNKIRRLIIKEKHIARGEIRYERFVEKWQNYTQVYDFRGPDLLTII